MPLPVFGGGSEGRLLCFFFQAEDGIRDLTVTGVQTCALPISAAAAQGPASADSVVVGDRDAPVDDERADREGAEDGCGDGEPADAEEPDPRVRLGAPAEWRSTLTAAGLPDTLLGVADPGEHGLDLTHAHPSGLATLLAGRPTPLPM